MKYTFYKQSEDFLREERTFLCQLRGYDVVLRLDLGLDEGYVRIKVRGLVGMVRVRVSGWGMYNIS